VHADKLLRRQVESELKRRRYIVYTILFLSILYVTATLLFGERGLMRYFEVHGKESALRTEVVEMKEGNEELRQVIELSDENRFYLEKHARENFGLAEPDEFIYLYEEK
jgi:cell division protein FtsB